MLRLFKTALLPILCVGALTACANDGSLTTSSINNNQVAKPAVDPACVSLVSKIDSLRKDGITDRVAKAGTGKSKTVPVYRTSLARMAELDRTNAEYQRRCGTLKPATAAIKPTVTSATKTAATNAATSTAKTAAKNTAKTAANKAVTKAATSKTATKAAAKVAPVVKTVEKAAATTTAVQKAAADTTAKPVAQ